MMEIVVVISECDLRWTLFCLVKWKNCAGFDMCMFGVGLVEM